MSAPLLQVQDLHKIYDNGVHAVKGVSFEVERGEFLAVIGLSGSGKSSMLRCLNRLVEPTEGKIFFDGTEMTDLRGAELREQRKRIGMIFQHFNLVPRKSVLSNVLTGRLGSTSTLGSLMGSFSEADKAKARECLEVVGLAGREGERATALSGGQQQRVAIARTLLQDPDLILADEPVASLDPATSHSVMRYLERANQELGKTILCNLHFLSLVRQYATRVLALKDGRIVFEGGAKEIDEDLFREIYGEEAQEVGVN